MAFGLLLGGVQVHEVFATGGAWLTIVASLVLTARANGWAREIRVFWPVFAYLAWSLLGPALCGFPPTGTGVARLLDVLILPAATVVSASVSSRALGRIAIVVSIVLVTSCIAAGCQYVGWWPKSETFSMLWWAQVPTDRVYEPIPGSGGRFMAGGLLLHRLRFANVTGALTVLALGSAVLFPRCRALLATVGSIGFVAVLLFPHARAATIALVIALLAVAVSATSNRNRAAMWSAVVIGIAALTVLATPSLRLRFLTSLTPDGSSDRTFLIQAGLESLQTHPLSGLGLGRFQAGNFAPPEAPEALRVHRGKTHNQFLTVAAEGGAPALVLLLILLASVARRALRVGSAASSALGVLVFFVVTAMVHDPLFHAESSMALWGTLGTAAGLARRLEEL
jgi:O-antigen ligase